MNTLQQEWNNSTKNQKKNGHANGRRNIEYADDDTKSLRALLALRAPSLIIGLMLGIGISFATSEFEEVLSRNVEVAFFLPFIVYIASAIGTQTETIYSRDLRSGRAKFGTYLKKEFLIGLLFGILFGAFSWFISLIWLDDSLLSMSIAIAAFLAITTAPIVALLTAQAFQLTHKDPAVGTGPLATVLQDILSIVIYGLVASFIIL